MGDETSFFLGATAPKERSRGRLHVGPEEEYKRHEFLKAAVTHKPDLLGKTGDGGNTRFTAGFFRRTGLEKDVAAQAQRREAEKEERWARRTAVRQARLAETAGRNGNVITGDGMPSNAGEGPRGRKYISDEPSAVLKHEGEQYMRDTAIRFFREPNGKDPRDDPRAKRLAEDALDPSRRKTALLGFGGADLESYGVRDAFDKSEYVVNAPKVENTKVTTRGKSSKSGGAFAPRLDFDPGSESDPFARHLEQTAPRRLKKGERAPDHVFAATEGVKLQAAMPDPEAKAIRLEKEIKAKLPKRPKARPQSLLATAARLDVERRLQAKQREIQAVRDLH